MSEEGEQTKEAAIISLFQEWDGCTNCELGELRKERHSKTQGRYRNMVMGDGNVDADIVVIGIGPGEEEDETGMPYIGPSGEILNEHLSKVGILRTDLFLMNVVASRPVSEIEDFKTKRKRVEQRDPSLQEREACRKLWQEVIYLIDPLIIVALGKPAIAEVLGVRAPTLTSMQGRVKTGQIPGRAVPATYTVIPMYHPAYLARSGDVFEKGVWHQSDIAWYRTVYFLDRLRYHYRGTPIPDRGFKRSDLFTTSREWV